MSSITALSDVTGSVLTDKAGMIAAFGDFNGDKHADIFVIAANGAYFRLEHIFDIKSKHRIRDGHWTFRPITISAHVNFGP